MDVAGMTRRSLAGRDEVPNLLALQPPLRLATGRRVDAGCSPTTYGEEATERN